MTITQKQAAALKKVLVRESNAIKNSFLKMIEALSRIDDEERIEAYENLRKNNESR